MVIWVWLTHPLILPPLPTSNIRSQKLHEAGPVVTGAWFDVVPECSMQQDKSDDNPIEEESSTKGSQEVSPQYNIYMFTEMLPCINIT